MNRHPGDLFNLAGKLNRHKLQNLYRVWRSYKYSQKTGDVIHPAHPVAVSIEPTTSCNLRCPECPSGLRAFTRPTGMLDPQLFQKAVDELSKNLINLTFYFQGEPYLNPAFLEMVKYAAQRKIYTSTSTNAHYLTDDQAEKTVLSGLDRLIISLDGISQESYEKYRVGGTLDKVFEGTARLVAAKKRLKSRTPHLVFQFLVLSHNEHELDAARKLTREIGVQEISFKTAQLYDFENGNPLMPEQEKFSRYKKGRDGKFRIKNPLDDHCWKMWHSAVITWDGDVLPCCFDKDGQYKMGNIRKESFNEIWNNGKYREFRTNLFRGRKEIDICKNCSEGTRVWA